MNKKIKIGMDISQLAHKGGVATYTRNLSHELSSFTDLEMVYFYSSLRTKYSGDLKNVKKYKLPPSFFEILFNRWRNVPIEKFIGPVDVYHSSDWIQPPTKAKKITTVHDLTPILFPHWSNPKIVDVHKRRLKIIESEADCVIVVSDATKKDLMKVSRIPENKIKVIYEGPTVNFQKPSEEKIREFREKYKLPQNFILAIGGIGERKNLERIKLATKNYELIITGETISWIDNDELVCLYYSASVLLYTSLYEGFGLPIIDAFNCGLPVITSNLSSMVEIAGEGAVLVDPYNVSQMQSEVKRLMEDNELRKVIIKKGFERAKFFSWKKCAEQTADLYRSIVAV